MIANKRFAEMVRSCDLGTSLRYRYTKSQDFLTELLSREESSRRIETRPYDRGLSIYISERIFHYRRIRKLRVIR